MGDGRVQVIRGATGPHGARSALRAEGLQPFGWGNRPGYHYAPHDHSFRSVIVCTAGSITFHVGGRDLTLRAGDRLDLGAGVEHAATVGPEGVECVEATLDAR